MDVHRFGLLKNLLIKRKLYSIVKNKEKSCNILLENTINFVQLFKIWILVILTHKFVYHWGVKYILSLKEENSSKLKLVFREGETRVYENKDAFPRAFLVYDYQVAKNKREAIKLLMEGKIDLKKTAILEEELGTRLSQKGEGRVLITHYEEGKVEMMAESKKGEAILIFTNNFYPGWRVKVDNQERKLYLVDYCLQGVVIPEGKHKVEFRYEG